MSRIGAPGRTRRVGAVTFIYFALIMLPVLAFSASLAVDFTQIIVAKRQVANTAQAAALAGAQQFIPDTPYVDSAWAKTEAIRTYCLGAQRGTMKLSQATAAATGRVSCPADRDAGTTTTTVNVAVSTQDAYGVNADVNAVRVEVHATFRIPGLVFTKFVVLLLGVHPTAAGGDEFEVTESAAVCTKPAPVPSPLNPKVSPTNGFCYKAGRAH